MFNTNNFLQELSLLVSTSCSEYSGASVLTELNGSKTNTTRSAMNENRLSLLQLCLFKQAVECSHKNDRNSRSLFECHIVWNLNDQLGRLNAIRFEQSIINTIVNNSITWLDISDIIANLCDNTSSF
ncbi:hypothetical protein D3C80_1785950 [compost metagenome]